MVQVMTGDRLVASRMLMRRLKEIRAGSHRAAPASAGNLPVLLALEDELMSSVAARMYSYEPPVILAVYYPASETLILAELGLGEPASGAMKVNQEKTTVGMVVDAARPMRIPGRWETINVTQLADA